jgi:hypothetical protein
MTFGFIFGGIVGVVAGFVISFLMMCLIFASRDSDEKAKRNYIVKFHMIDHNSNEEYDDLAFVHGATSREEACTKLIDYITQRGYTISTDNRVYEFTGKLEAIDMEHNDVLPIRYYGQK